MSKNKKVSIKEDKPEKTEKTVQGSGARPDQPRQGSGTGTHLAQRIGSSQKSEKSNQIFMSYRHPVRVA